MSSSGFMVYIDLLSKASMVVLNKNCIELDLCFISVSALLDKKLVTVLTIYIRPKCLYFVLCLIYFNKRNGFLLKAIT